MEALIELPTKYSKTNTEIYCREKINYVCVTGDRQCFLSVGNTIMEQTLVVESVSYMKAMVWIISNHRSELTESFMY